MRAITISSAFNPDCGYYKSTIVLIGDVFCPNTNCSGKLCLHKRFFSISRQKRLWLSAMRVCVPGAQFSFPRSIKFLFLVVWLSDLHFWWESTINSRFYWRCLLSWQVLFQQRKRWISWRLCNKSEIHLRLWKMWSLLVSSKNFLLWYQSTQIRQSQTKRAFLQKKMKLLPSKQVFINVLFQSTNCRKKELFVDNKVQETIGNVYCSTCRNENSLHCNQ